MSLFDNFIENLLKLFEAKKGFLPKDEDILKFWKKMNVCLSLIL